MTVACPRRRTAAGLFAALLLLAACGDSAGPAVPAQVTVTGGDQQAVTVGEAAPIPLSVKVTTQGGAAVQGEEVVWRVVSGSATVDPDTSSTDAGGVATTTLRMGQSAGEVTVSATVRDLAPATFVLEAVPGEATRVVTVAGNNQTGPVGQPLPDPVVVEAQDAAGNPVPGATIEFSSSIGSLSPTSVSTDAQGRASATWTLPTTPGEHDALARLAGSTAGAVLKATATAGAPTTLEKVSGEGQQAAPGSAVSDPLVVRVLDSFGNPVPGVDVAFSTPDGGSFTPAQPVTGEQGVAQTTWTLGSDTTRVNQTATATVPGAGSVTFAAIANDPCDDFAVYTIGETVTGTLENFDCQLPELFGDNTWFDLYDVTVTQQGFYQFDVTSSAFQAYALIFPDFAQAAAPAVGDTARIEAIAEAGRYLLAVNQFTQTAGEYTLLSRERPELTNGCTPLWLLGSIQTEQAITTNDCPPVQEDSLMVDFYRLTLFQGDTLDVDLTSGEIGTLVRLVVLNQDRSLSLVALDSAAAGQVATVQHVAPQGAFYLLFTSASSPGATGSYTLSTRVRRPAALRSDERWLTTPAITDGVRTPGARAGWPQLVPRR